MTEKIPSREQLLAVVQGYRHSHRFARCASLIGADESIELLILLCREASAVISRLRPGKKYLARELWGDLGWSGWSRGRKVCAGICLSYLVERQAISLRWHRTRSGRGPRRYTRLPTSGLESR